MSTLKERYNPNIGFTPYLKLPIRTPVHITEGFIYSKEERDIHGFYRHNGIDYAGAWGTPIYAAASGYAVAGYHRFTKLNEDNTPNLYKGKPFSLGLGYFIQIYHPPSISKTENGRITQYAHLSSFAEGIKINTHKPFVIDFDKEIRRKNNKLRKQKKGEKELKEIITETKKLEKQYPWISKLYGFSPKESYLYKLEELKDLHQKKSPYVKWVEQGDQIGYMGLSGLIHGDLGYRENMKKPHIAEFEYAWDDVHLHFEEAERNLETGAKCLHRDPYGIYLSRDNYTTLPTKTLFL